MYDRVKSTLLWLLRVPPEPHDPMGDVHSLRVFRAAPGYLRYITLAWALSEIGILLGGLLAFIPLAVAAATSLAAILVTALGLLTAVLFLGQAGLTFFSLRLNYEMRWYKVTDRSLRIRAGVWNVHEMTMTFANVQNITISQGPLERLFGISDVKVDTAGGGGSSGSHGKAEGLNLHVATFRGVDNPEEIRDLMLQRLRRLRDAGLGDLDDAPGLKDAPVYDPAFGSTETLQALAAFRDEARALRRAAETVRAVHSGHSGTIADPPVGTNRRLYGDRDPVAAMGFADKVQLLTAADAYARAIDSRVRQVSLSLAGDWQSVEIIRPGGHRLRDLGFGQSRTGNLA